MGKFIKIIRVKPDEEFPIHVNTDYIIAFIDHKDGGSVLNVSFPDTIRAYVVKKTPEEIIYYFD